MKSLFLKLVILITLSSSGMIFHSITGFVDGASQESTAANDTKESISTSSSSSLAASTITGSNLESISPSSDTSSESLINTAYLASKDASDSKHDQIPQASTANVHHQHPNHRNHQNYPLEPFTGAASYSSITVSTPAPSVLPFNQSSGSFSTSNQQQHHTSSQNDNALNTFSNSYGNQAAQLDRLYSSSSSGNGESHNYNYILPGGSSGGSTLNTGLIQNLTASLFPIKQLSNATLYTLSELLNKTRQTSPTYSQFSNGYKPTFNLAYPAYFSTQPSQATIGSASSSSNANPLATATNYGIDSSVLGNAEQQLNLFDYIRPNQFGFRQPSQGRYHSQVPSSSAFFRHSAGSPGQSSKSNSGPLQNQYNSYTSLPNSAEQYFTSALDNNLHPGYKTSSNIYNTYIPFKDNINSLPTMTNGQSLNMALYGYKLPLMVNKPMSSFATSSNNNNNPNNIGSGYQFIQQHNMNNQNHLDKVVYHSTPFRPSIVSPPLSSVSSNPNTTPSSVLSSTPASSSGQQNNQVSSSTLNQRTKMDSGDSKSLAFGSLSSSSSAISDSKSDYTTNGQANNASKYSSVKDSSNSRVGGSDSNGAQYNNKGLSSNNDKTSTTTTSTMSPLATDDGSSMYDGLRAHNSTIDKQSTITPSQEMLFNLYEREIDNQIRDALYSEAPHATAESLLPGVTRASNVAADWFEKSAQTLYEDPSVEQTLSSWDRPVALGTHGGYHLPTGSGATTRIRDPLAEALQELPTFSASDLQPIFPAGPAYSLLPTSTHDPSSYHEPQQPPSASQPLASFSSLFPFTNQQHGHHNPMGLDSEINSKLTSFQQPSTSHSTTPSSSSSQPAGLQAILIKLHSSPLSSILSAPLSQLYSTFPRPYRNNKKPSSHSQQHSSKQQNNHQQSILNAYNQLSSGVPSSLFSHHTFGGISGKQLLSALSNGNSLFDTLVSASSNSHKTFESPQSVMKQKQQQKQQQAALSAAINPFQAAALLQAQAGNIIYIPAGSEPTSELTMIGRATTPGGFIATHPASFAEPPTQAGFGLSGTGITPLIWRSIFSPVHWARKQSTSSSGQSSGQLLQASNLSPAINSQSSSSSQASFLQGSHKLANSGQETSVGSGSNAAISMNKQQLPAHLNAIFAPSTGQKGSIQKRPKIKIKILKIPVAYYEQAPSGSGSLQGAAAAAPAISLAPSQLQPAVTASLLASLPCPLHQGTLQPAHTLEQHILNQSTSTMPLSATSVLPSLPLQAQPSSSLDTQLSIINQPDDLQVLPSSLQGKLFKMLQQAAA